MNATCLFNSIKQILRIFLNKTDSDKIRVSLHSILVKFTTYWEISNFIFVSFLEFFMELDAAVGLLSLTSSMTELVHYIRQGLHWLRLETKLL